jgi:hypothetical protein
MNSKIMSIKSNFNCLLFGVFSIAVGIGCVTALAGGGFIPFIIVDIAGDAFGGCPGGGAALVGA